MADFQKILALTPGAQGSKEGHFFRITFPKIPEKRIYHPESGYVRNQVFRRFLSTQQILEGHFKPLGKILQKGFHRLSEKKQGFNGLALIPGTSNGGVGTQQKRYPQRFPSSCTHAFPKFRVIFKGARVLKGCSSLKCIFGAKRFFGKTHQERGAPQKRFRLVGVLLPFRKTFGQTFF